jgi:Flp pilus assembly protein TadG
MTGHLWQIRKSAAVFFAEQDGVAMTEAIVVVPFLTLFAVGVIEFGALFWQREQIETGLRDAARYMARCRHPIATCETTARNLAYYGSSAQTAERVPGWNDTNSPITFTPTTVGTQDIIRARTAHDLVNSPLFNFLGIGTISISADHNQRMM